MYTLRCRHGDREFDLTWDDGQVGGDPNAVMVLESTAQAYEDSAVPVGPPGGPVYVKDYLADPYAMFWLAREVFEVVGVEGDTLTRDPAPEGALI